MDPKEKIIGFMRQGIEFEESDVFGRINGSLKLLDSVDIPTADKAIIREKLELLRTETISHIERFKKAHRELETGEEGAY